MGFLSKFSHVIVLAGALLSFVSCNGGGADIGLAASEGESAAIGNRPPVAFDVTVNVNFNLETPFQLLATDADGDQLSYILEDPIYGNFLGYAPNLTFKPLPGVSIPETISYRVHDGTTYSNMATITVLHNGQNNPPVATGGTLAVAYQLPAALNLNVTDPDGDTIYYEIVTEPVNGTLSGTAPALTYTPNNGFTGSDIIRFRAYDEHGGFKSYSSVVNVIINVTNNKPTVTSSSAHIAPITSHDFVITASDADGHALTWTFNNPANGTIAIAGSGNTRTVTYTPNSGYSGPDSFSYTVSDGNMTSNPGVVTITVAEKMYFYFDSDVSANRNWTTVENWWLNQAHTIPANRIPQDDDYVVVISGTGNPSGFTGTAPALNLRGFEGDASTNEDTNNEATKNLLIKEQGKLVVSRGSWMGQTVDQTVTVNFIEKGSLGADGQINGPVSFTCSERSYCFNKGVIEANGGDVSFEGAKGNLGEIASAANVNFVDSDNEGKVTSTVVRFSGASKNLDVPGEVYAESTIFEDASRNWGSVFGTGLGPKIELYDTAQNGGVFQTDGSGAILEVYFFGNSMNRNTDSMPATGGQIIDGNAHFEENSSDGGSVTGTVTCNTTGLPCTPVP